MSVELRKRGRSLPAKPVFVRAQKCLFFHAKGYCCWGSMCRFTHLTPKKKYVEKVAVRPTLEFEPPKVPDFA
jgi:hypothetical protein